MHYRIGRFFLLLSAAMLTGCNDGTKNKVYLPESTGSTNQLMVVSSRDLWEGEVGDSIRAKFSKPVLGLNRPEPLFSIQHIPNEAFKTTYRYGRSILIVGEDEAESAGFARNKYAEAQEIAIVKGKDRAALIRGLERIADSATKRYKRNEISEVQRRFLKSLNTSMSIRDSFGYDLRIPSLYDITSTRPGFMWIDRRITNGHINLLLYQLEEGQFQADSTMVQTILSVKDSIGRNYVPGPDIPGKVTYLTTEKMFAPFIQETRIAGMKAYEVRGLWEMENFPMGGPYLSYWVHDPGRSRWIVLHGFVFAPSELQRDHIFEVEAIFRSLELEDVQSAG